jgi:hypothetical protein
MLGLGFTEIAVLALLGALALGGAVLAFLRWGGDGREE